MVAIEGAEEVRQLLRQLFDAAAAKSLAVINQDDAEPEMAHFLQEVKQHSDQRGFVVQLFTDSFNDTFYMWGPPWKLLQFCMHDLRWPEIREFVQSRKDEDVNTRGARSSAVWNDVLDAFEDHWSGAEQFQRFRQSSQ